MYCYLSALCERRLAAGDAYLRSDDLVIGGMKEAHQHSNSSIPGAISRHTSFSSDTRQSATGRADRGRAAAAPLVERVQQASLLPNAERHVTVTTDRLSWGVRVPLRHLQLVKSCCSETAITSIRFPMQPTPRCWLY